MMKRSAPGMLACVADRVRHLAHGAAPVDRRASRRRIVIATEDEQRQREEQKQHAGRHERRHAAAVSRERHERVQRPMHAVAELCRSPGRPPLKNGSTSSTPTIEPTYPTAVPKPDSRPCSSTGTSSGQHRVVERLRCLIGEVRDDERGEHREQRRRLTCHPGAWSPVRRHPRRPAAASLTETRPSRAQARHDAIVNPTTHGFRRRRASDIAPRNGIASTTSIDATAFAIASTRFVTRDRSRATPRSTAWRRSSRKSCSRSRRAPSSTLDGRRANDGRISPPASRAGTACCG